MTDNVVKSTDINKEKEVAKKAPAKKAAQKKVASVKKEAPVVQNDEMKVVIFESGYGYTADGIQFSREDYIKEVPAKLADHLLTLENFRLADQLEIEEYFANKEN